MSDERPGLADRLGNAAFLALMGAVRLLPYERRIPAMGWIFSRLLAPVAGWRRRIRANLAMARPDLSETEIAALLRAVPDNAGRSLAEIYSGEEFTARIHASDPLEGPGLPVLEDAFAQGRPVILACAHFGNYDAMRAALLLEPSALYGLYQYPKYRALVGADGAIPVLRVVGER